MNSLNFWTRAAVMAAPLLEHMRGEIRSECKKVTLLDENIFYGEDPYVYETFINLGRNYSRSICTETQARRMTYNLKGKEISCSASTSDPFIAGPDLEALGFDENDIVQNLSVTCGGQWL